MNATAQSASLTERSRALLAALVAFVLAVSGALVAAPAYAATATVNGSITAANEAGLAVTIDFTGVEEIPAGKTGVYVALTESGTTNVVFPGQYVPAATIVGGAGSGSYTAPAANLDRSTSYEALVWFAHGNPTADVIVGRQSVAISGAQWDAVFGAEDDDESDGEGSGGDGEGSGGDGEGSGDEGDSGEDGDSGEGDSGEGAEDGDSGEEGGAFTPVLSASLEDGTELSSGATVYKGDTVVVRGSGFDPEGNVSTRAPVTVGDPAGNYVVFGNFAEAWQPSTGAGSGDRAVAVQRWAMTDATFANIDARYINAVAGQRVTLGTDGSFEFSIELAGISGAAPEGGSYGVFTYVAGGASNDPDQELELRLDYIDSERPSPSITAELADGTELADGATVYKNDTVVVRGAGFDPEGNLSTRAPVTVGDPAGNYVVFGNFAEAWRPSGGAAGSQRSVGDQRWAMTDATFANIDARYINAVAGQRIVLTEDGTFEAELTAKAAAAAPGSYGVFTYVAGGAPNDPAQELELRLEYVDEERPSGPALEVFAADGVTPVGDSPLYEGDTVVVRGSGFDPEGNVSTRAPVTVGDPAGNYVVFGNFAEAWQPSTGAGSGDRAVAVQRWAMTDATFANIDARYINAVAGQRVTLGTDGSFEFSIELAGISGAAPEGGSYGVFTYVAGGAPNDPAQELEVRLDYRGKAPATPTPELTVSPSSDLDPEAANVLTVTGTGFAGPGAANGAYILFGETSVWSGGAPLPSEGWIVQSWVPAALISDGAFSTTLTIPAGTLDPDKTYHVASNAAHGLSQTDRSLDAFAAVTVAQPATGPSQEGSLTWGFAPSFISYVEGPIAGGAVTVAAPATRAGGLFTFAQSLAGTSFDADKGTVAYAGSLRFTGHHGALDITVANPVITVTSATAGTLAVTSGGERVVLATLDLSKATRSASDGALTFTGAPATLTAAGLEKVFDGAAPTSGLAPVTFTVGVASVVVPPEPPTGPVGPKPPTTPTTPTTPTAPTGPTVPGGSLRWAISSSFASYVTGPIAKGAISVSGGATRSGSQFQFGQAAGSTFDPATGTGSVSYVGSVRFTGHHGVLDVTISNPRIVITSANAATLYVTSGGAQVPFATLNLGAGAKTTNNGAVTYTAVPASLTSAGLNQVFAGYNTSLNPVTFTIGAAASAPAGASGTVASAASDEDSVELPASPPATEGIEADADSLAAFSAGGAGTFSASGFEANEEGIKVVVYSTPVLLDTVTADADGVATWTGAVPATLADGEHTLTFQGSVDRGLVFTLERGATSLAVGPCLVEGATLQWGFKESFRVYIEGIAKGGWDLTDVEYQYPDYVWTGGTGAIDPDAATGLVTLGGTLAFHGHDGALDTTLTNARIELAGERGYLVFDITGTTQEGDDVDLKDVRFAEFSLEGAEISDGALTLDALPATLTEAGAAAFGTYPAGEELDAVSAVIPVAADCGAPVEAEPIVDAAPVEAAPEESDAGGAPTWPWVAGGVLLALLLGIGIGVLATRGRKPAAAEVTAE